MTAKDMSLERDDALLKGVQVDRLKKRLKSVNHDLRQPLQTMELLCGVLNAKTQDEEVLKVNARIEETLRSAISMLDSLFNLDVSDAPFEQENEPQPQPAPLAGAREAFSPPDQQKALMPTVFIVDDDREVREAMGDLLKSHGFGVELYESCEAFLANRVPHKPGIMLIDAQFPGMSGLDLLKQLKEKKDPVPSVMITGRGDITLAVQAMKGGAVDFIEKPINHKELLKIVTGVAEQNQDASRAAEDRESALVRLARLSARERQVMEMVLEGQLNKNIAADLGISQRTVETHRANIMRKMEVKSLPALLRLTMSAA
jgi:FixJ family two-component response regulator